MKKKNIVILGSTGSIGVNALKVVGRFRDQFNVVGLSAYSNISLLEKQIQAFSPSHVAITDEGKDCLKRKGFKSKCKIWNVYEDLESLVTLKEVDIVLIAMRGSAALKPFLEAVRCAKTVAPANKEALVVAGEILMKEADKSGAHIIPIDSEQSAIFQCIDRHAPNAIHKVYLTASGGTLRNVDQSEFNSFSVDKMLEHPTWKMGDKITIDSASLMNKGFEVIEAMRLFHLEANQIEVLIHPQSIIHSMVEYEDGSILAQLGITDMRLPIQYALTYPERRPSGLKSLDFLKLKQLTFEKPDYEKFPALKLALYVAKKGGTLPSVLNAADEEAVEAYLKEEIRFTDIYAIVEKVVKRHKSSPRVTLNAVTQADQWARQEAQKELIKLKCVNT